MAIGCDIRGCVPSGDARLTTRLRVRRHNALRDQDALRRAYYLIAGGITQSQKINGRAHRLLTQVLVQRKLDSAAEDRSKRGNSSAHWAPRLRLDRCTQAWPTKSETASESSTSGAMPMLSSGPGDRRRIDREIGMRRRRHPGNQTYRTLP